MLSVITAMIAAHMEMAAMQAQIEALENRPPEVVTEYVTEHVTEYTPYPVYVTEYVEVPGETYIPPEEQAVECGMCGAHVIEWWYVRNDADTAFVEVCHDCYELCQE